MNINMTHDWDDFDKIIVIDNFYSNPDNVRSIALKADYETDRHNKNWPGMNSCSTFFGEQLIEGFRKITGENIVHSNDNKSGFFRLTEKGAAYKQLIHFDPNPRQVWAGVWYGTPIKDEEIQNTCGTKFWYHKRLNISRMPALEEDRMKLGFYGHNEMRDFMQTEGLDRSLWECHKNIEYKYNRLVLFRPWFWHSIAGMFGDSKETARLVQLFFFDLK